MDAKMIEMLYRHLEEEIDKYRTLRAEEMFLRGRVQAQKVALEVISREINKQKLKILQ